MKFIPGRLSSMQPKLAILETSQRIGWVALAEGGKLLGSRRLDEARRHARDLVPALGELLAEQSWKAKELQGVVVSRGPGSYTGLRVGIMSAKTLAYASGCKLLAVDTFAALAWQSPPGITQVEVLADAQQDKIYVQSFQHDATEKTWHPLTELKIVTLATWLAKTSIPTWVTGPGLEIFANRLPSSLQSLPQECWLPRPESLLHLGLAKFLSGRPDDLFTLEPLYLRPSSAEEKMTSDK